MTKFTNPNPKVLNSFLYSKSSNNPSLISVSIQFFLKKFFIKKSNLHTIISKELSFQL